MRTAMAGASALAFIGLTALPVSAHESDQVRYELRQRGYYNIEFLVAEAPYFQADACRDGDRYHLHVDFYGRITQRTPIGPCHRDWAERRGEGTFRDYRYRR